MNAVNFQTLPDDMYVCTDFLSTSESHCSILLSEYVYGKNYYILCILFVPNGYTKHYIQFQNI